MTFNIKESGEDPGYPDWKSVVQEENADIIMFIETGLWDDNADAKLNQYLIEFNSYFPQEDPYTGYAQGASLAVSGIACFSRYSITHVTQIHSEYLLKEFNLHKAVEEIRKDFLQFLNDDVEDISNKPRIILLAKKYRPEVTATILWLRDFGIDITCIQFIPYIIEENQIAFESKILIPLPEAKSFIMQRERKNQGPKSPSRPTSEISVKDHISQKPELMVSLFNILAPKILALHKNMEEVPTPGYIAYKVFNNNVLEVQIQKSKINFVLSHPFSEYNKKGPIPEKLEAVPLSFGWGDKCRYNLYSQKDIPVVVDLIKQALDYVIQKRCL